MVSSPESANSSVSRKVVVLMFDGFAWFGSDAREDGIGRRSVSLCCSPVSPSLSQGLNCVWGERSVVALFGSIDRSIDRRVRIRAVATAQVDARAPVHLPPDGDRLAPRV